MYTTKEEKWNNLEELAVAILLKGQGIDMSCHYIKLYVNPTFSNKFIVEFEVMRSHVNWYSTVWKSDLDRLKIYSAPLEKEIPEPTFNFKKGSYSKENFKPINYLVQKISISPFIHDDWGDMRDGEIYTLTIGFKGCVVNYRWHYLPDSWAILGEISERILQINKQYFR